MKWLITFWLSLGEAAAYAGEDVERELWDTPNGENCNDGEFYLAIYVGSGRVSGCDEYVTRHMPALCPSCSLL